MELRPENLALVYKALVAGVNEVGGTAYRARLSDVDVAGKTGTAQVSHRLARGAEAERVWYFNREHAWFAGFAPTKSPEVAVVVLVEHGGVGGKHAAPIAFEVVRAYQQLSRERAAQAKKDAARAAKGGAAADPKPGNQPAGGPKSPLDPQGAP
jgi:penicillin-binding protein 2